MESVTDLRIIGYDQAWAKSGHVVLRYTAEGSHCGKPYQGVQVESPPRKARWGATAIFEAEGGRIRSFLKDWDQKVIEVSSWASTGGLTNGGFTLW